MTVEVRSEPVRPPIYTFGDLAAWIDHRLNEVNGDLGEGEYLQSVGQRGEARLLGRRAELENIAAVIAPLVAAEEQDRQQTAAEDGEEARWKATYPDADELTLRRLAGDR